VPTGLVAGAEAWPGDPRSSSGPPVEEGPVPAIAARARGIPQRLGAHDSAGFGWNLICDQQVLGLNPSVGSTRSHESSTPAAGCAHSIAT
jgi:hypothetical protein